MKKPVLTAMLLATSVLLLTGASVAAARSASFQNLKGAVVCLDPHVGVSIREGGKRRRELEIQTLEVFQTAFARRGAVTESPLDGCFKTQGRVEVMVRVQADRGAVVIQVEAIKRASSLREDNQVVYARALNGTYEHISELPELLSHVATQVAEDALPDDI
ncbi:hypothetical protein [Deinococcus soli (ex Cha et al. 2016)]|uniref:Uncharacterized protein n=2 Tax=Deinococcus soli (ex Cha et al. 2016) TaxID=1309411 RepID=A0AAE4BMX6_9DEIO|nr:hypothetical protein [Deinococcus soli (ex Cha et al. 2016)]MDR6218136.1 hypothetical protein [Deinococcus soli (ex Cha et al. 2016)]MDR6328876.1 hypothetical protein [Deinococcus soli (ex Cha et al. 2016)]MDR6751636.1 hypothetical protein [Deinococcus soli (ex Cha et al. 2016)]